MKDHNWTLQRMMKIAKNIGNIYFIMAIFNNELKKYLFSESRLKYYQLSFTYHAPNPTEIKWILILTHTYVYFKNVRIAQ